MFSVQCVSSTLSALISITRLKPQPEKLTKCLPTKTTKTPAYQRNDLLSKPQVAVEAKETERHLVVSSKFDTFKKLFERKNQSKFSWEIKFQELQDLKFIGGGAQGRVFSGTYRGKPIAFKKVFSAKETDLKYIKKLSHPNVVRFRGACVDGPNFGIVMELCALGNLHVEIYRRTSIGSETVHRWASDIASGMNYLHQNGIVHRDLKPHNILLKDPFSSLKIADFDISQKIGKHASPITFAGTVAYMAPEVLRQVSLTFKVDVWAYGVVLWEILTRRTPYDNCNELAIIYGVGLNTLRLQIPNNSPALFRNIVTSCLEKNPRERPSFEQILNLLKTSNEMNIPNRV